MAGCHLLPLNRGSGLACAGVGFVVAAGLLGDLLRRWLGQRSRLAKTTSLPAALAEVRTLVRQVSPDLPPLEGYTRRGLCGGGGRESLAATVLATEVLGRDVVAFLSVFDCWHLRPVGRSWRCLLEESLAAVATVEAGFIADAGARAFAMLDGRRSVGPKEIVDIFEAAVSTPDLLTTRDSSGQSLLMKSVDLGSPRLVAALLAAHADPNAKDNNGFTALHLAAVGRNAALCELLVEHRADVSLESADGYSALFYAQCAGGDGAALEAMMRLLDPAI